MVARNVLAVRGTPPTPSSSDPLATGSPSIDFTSDEWFLKRLMVDAWRLKVASARAAEDETRHNDGYSDAESADWDKPGSSTPSDSRGAPRLVRSRSGWWRRHDGPDTMTVPAFVTPRNRAHDDSDKLKQGAPRASLVPAHPADPVPNTTSWKICKLLGDPLIDEKKAQSLFTPAVAAAPAFRHDRSAQSIFNSCLFLPHYAERFLHKPPRLSMSWYYDIQV